MPIHDQGYRRYTGVKTPRGRSWAIITSAGVKTFLAKRAFVALLLLAWIPFIVRAVQVYAAANVPQMTFIAATAETFRQFLAQQDIFVFFVTVYVGAGLIANDRRANALQIYLSKPLTRFEYICGKLGILMIFLLMVTWVPAILLLLLQAAFAGNVEFLTSHLYLFPAITVLSFLEATMVSIAMLALSSISNNSRFVGILYAGLLLFTNVIAIVLRFVLRSTWVSFISFGNDLAQVGDVIFRMRPRFATPWPLSLLMIVLLIALSAWVLERRVRGVEVVA